MSEDLEMCAEFLGKEFFEYPAEGAMLKNGFNPHEEEGAYWQKQILRKFSVGQFNDYRDKLILAYAYGEKRKNVEMVRDLWLMAAPVEVSFECIVETLKLIKSLKSERS